MSLVFARYLAIFYQSILCYHSITDYKRMHYKNAGWSFTLYVSDDDENTTLEILFTNNFYFRFFRRNKEHRPQKWA